MRPGCGRCRSCSWGSRRWCSTGRWSKAAWDKFIICVQAFVKVKKKSLGKLQEYDANQTATHIYSLQVQESSHSTSTYGKRKPWRTNWADVLSEQTDDTSLQLGNLKTWCTKRIDVLSMDILSKPCLYLQRLIWEHHLIVQCAIRSSSMSYFLWQIFANRSLMNMFDISTWNGRCFFLLLLSPESLHLLHGQLAGNLQGPVTLRGLWQSAKK